MNPLLARKAAIDAIKPLFLGSAFVWGGADCAGLAAALLRQRGHDPIMDQTDLYTSELGARRVLLRRGFKTVIDWMDGVSSLERTDWSRALMGDIVALPGGEDGSWPGLAIAVGNGNVMGFHGDVGACAMISLAVVPLACWRT